MSYGLVEHDAEKTATLNERIVLSSFLFQQLFQLEPLIQLRQILISFAFLFFEFLKNRIRTYRSQLFQIDLSSSQFLPFEMQRAISFRRQTNFVFRIDQQVI